MLTVLVRSTSKYFYIGVIVLQSPREALQVSCVWRERIRSIWWAIMYLFRTPSTTPWSRTRRLVDVCDGMLHHDSSFLMRNFKRRTSSEPERTQWIYGSGWSTFLPFSPSSQPLVGFEKWSFLRTSNSCLQPLISQNAFSSNRYGLEQSRTKCPSWLCGISNTNSQNNSPKKETISMGNVWRLAVQCPDSYYPLPEDGRRCCL